MVFSLTLARSLDQKERSCSGISGSSLFLMTSAGESDFVQIGSSAVVYCAESPLLEELLNWRDKEMLY